MTRFILLSSFLITFSAFILKANSAQPGGFTKASVEDKHVIAAANFAIKEKNKKAGKNSKLELVKILNAESQVVAGVNYRLKLKFKEGGKEKSAVAEVWWQAWRNPDPYQLASWK